MVTLGQLVRIKKREVGHQKLGWQCDVQLYSRYAQLWLLFAHIKGNPTLPSTFYKGGELRQRHSLYSIRGKTAVGRGIEHGLHTKAFVCLQNKGSPIVLVPFGSHIIRVILLNRLQKVVRHAA